MKRKKRAKYRYRRRSAINGRFVKRAFADRHPKYCIRERGEVNRAGVFTS